MTSRISDDISARESLIDVDGRPRSYITVTEETSPSATPTESITASDSSSARALLLVLHGTRQTASSIRAFSGYSFDKLATDRTVVAYPDGFQRDWNGARNNPSSPTAKNGVDDIAFLRTLVGELQRTENIDPERVYVVGFSLGGQMVIRLVHDAPDLIAGGALLSSTQPEPANLHVDHPTPGPTPMLIMHGTRDPLTPYGGGAVGYRGLNLRGHNLSAPATAEYYARANGITDPPTSIDLAHRPDSGRTSVTRTDYQQAGCPPVVLYTVHGGGHQMHNLERTPARWLLGRSTHDITAAGAVADFFDLHRTP